MELENGLKEYTVKVDGFDIYFKCKFNPESEDALLFLHGLACSGESYVNLFDQDYFPNKSLVVIDLLGFGKSGKPTDFSYTMEDHAKILEKFLKTLPDWNYHIVVHSMGGAIGLLFSSEFLSKISSFTNIEGNLISEDCGIFSRNIVSLTLDYYENRLFKRHTKFFKDHDQFRFDETTARIIYESSKSLVQHSDNGKLLEIFKNLDSRKSYFYGEENLEMPILKQLDFAQKYMIENSGHGLMTDNPKSFYQKLVEFIYK